MAADDGIDEVAVARPYPLVAHAPDVAVAGLYHATIHALSLAAHNATMAQQQGNILWQAVTTQGVKMIYAIKFE